MELRNCKYCKKEFLPESKQQVFCCPQCRINYHNKKPLTKDRKKCIICGAEFTVWNQRQVTCGKKECVKINSNNTKHKKRQKKYLYAKNEGVTTPSPKKKVVKPWSRCTPSEKWERMTLTELSAEIARLYPGKSFGQVRLLKEQGLLPEEFGKECRK